MGEVETTDKESGIISRDECALSWQGPVMRKAADYSRLRSTLAALPRAGFLPPLFARDIDANSSLTLASLGKAFFVSSAFASSEFTALNLGATYDFFRLG
jgi:hypothetical protein